MNLFLEYLLLKNKRGMKNKKDVGEVKEEIPMVLEEYPNPKKKKNIKCYHYNKPGHMKKECKILKREQNEWKKNNQETNTIVAEGDIVIVCDD